MPLVTRPLLIVLAGLPGAGKSAIADRIGQALGAPVVSVDPIEAAMRRSGIDPTQPTGLAAYVVAETLAAAHLALGLDAVIDAVNAAPEAREQWRGLAEQAPATMAAIECVCSSATLHRRRLASRRRGLVGLPEPTWAYVEQQRAAWTVWPDDHLTVDSVQPLDSNVVGALSYLRERRRAQPASP